MRLLLSFLIPALLGVSPLSAQEKGVTPTSSFTEGDEGATYAVVVGISDYQDPAIPDLQYAHRDAEAFAEYLRSPAGGSLAEENLVMLQNEDATNARIADALIWLLETCRPGDKAIIYFSGHGDVETITRFNRGYLLTYDSPPKVYMAGAFNIRDLQDIISTLSESEVQVLMISDACRAGKLAGTEVGGTTATAQNLSKQFAKEVKILSCQPNEFSLEGEQWGGGRGAFSYHLLDGLQGLADKNEDALVNLFEIGRYLEDRVPEETAPHEQMPFTVGDRNTAIALVDQARLDQLREEKARDEPQLARIETKGMEALLLADADSSIQEMYHAFTAAIDNRQLLEPKDNSAYDLYQVLAQEEQIKDLHNIMRRKLSVALQEDAQQAINAYLAANPAEMERRYQNEEDYSLYPRYLEKACELLGPEHFYYDNLMAKRFYFEGLRLRMDADNKNESASYQQAIGKQKQALSYQENAPYIFNELGVLYTQVKKDDQAAEYLKQAMELAPEWGLPYANYSVGLFYAGEYEQSIQYGEKALQYLPDFPQMYNFLAWIYANESDWYDKRNWERKGLELSEEIQFIENSVHSIEQLKTRYQKAIELLEKAEQLDAANFQTSLNLGIIYQQLREFEKGEAALKKAIQKDSTQARPFFYLGRLYLRWRKTEAGKEALLRFIELSSSEKDKSDGYNSLQWAYSQEGNEEMAIQLLQKAIDLDPSNPFPYLNIGNRHIRRGDLKKGEHIILKGLTARDDFPLTYTYLVRLYERMNRPEEVDYFSKKGLEIKPDNVRLTEELVKYYGENGQLDKALEWQKKLMEITPDDPSSYLTAGKLAYKNNQAEKAEVHFNKAVELATGEMEHRILGRIGHFCRIHSAYSLAEKYLNQAIKLKPEHVWHYWALAWVYYSSDRRQRAYSLLDEAIALLQKPEDKAQLHYQKGLLAYYEDDLKKSRKYLKRAAELKDDYYPLLQSVEALGQNDPVSADSLLKEAIKRNPRDDNMMYILAQLKLSVGQAEAALDQLEKAFQITGRTYDFMQNDPHLDALRTHPRYQHLMYRHFPEKYDDLDTFEFEQETPVYYLENCVLLSKYYERESEIERARFLYKKAIALRSYTLTKREKLALAEAYLKLRDYEKAKAICPDSIDSERPSELFEAGKLFYLLNKQQAAQAHFERYLAVSKSATPHDAVALFYKTHGKMELASPLFKLAISDNPEAMFLRRNLARLYYFSGEKEAAFKVLREAISLHPEDLSTQGVLCMLSYFDNPSRSKTLFEASEWLQLWEVLELMRLNQYAQADNAWKAINESYNFWWLELAKYKYLQMKVRQGKMDEALDLFQEILNKGVFVNYHLYKTDTTLDPIRDTDGFKELMRLHFPEKTTP